MELAEADLEGLPDFVVDAARAAGEEKGAGGPVVTLSRSLIVPFLQFSPAATCARKPTRPGPRAGANGGETDNRAIAAEILALRENARRFWAMKISRPTSWKPRWPRRRGVRELLMAVWDPAKARADADAAVLKR
jgi:peptidyl-dipeptidase Dcp